MGRIGVSGHISRQQAGQHAQPTRTFTPPPLTLAHGEQDAIAQDPVGYVVAQREQDASIQEIRNRLILAGIDAASADGLIQSAKAPYDSDRKERGVRRIKKGVALAVGGLALTVLLGLLSGIFVLLGVALTLAGLFQLGKGIYEVKGQVGWDSRKGTGPGQTLTGASFYVLSGASHG